MARCNERGCVPFNTREAYPKKQKVLAEDELREGKDLYDILLGHLPSEADRIIDLIFNSNVSVINLSVDSMIPHNR